MANLRWIGEPPAEHPPGIFPGLFPDHGALLISGGKEVGKSLMALEICHAAVTGESLWDLLKPTRTLEKVLYIFAEHGGYGSLAQQWTVTGFQDPEKRIWVCDTLKPLITRGAVNVAHRDFYCQAAHGTSLIVWDPLGAFMQGEEVENQASPTRALINTMEWIGNTVGAYTLILGHFGKLQYRPETGETVHSGTRGSSALEHAATAVFYLSKATQGDKYQVYRLDNEFFKGVPLKKIWLRRPDDELRHHADPEHKNPVISRVRMIAGRKGGKASVLARQHPTTDSGLDD